MRSFVFSYFLAICAGLGFLSTEATAQNLIFLSFDYPYKEVQKTLYNVENVQILFEQDDTKIAARHGTMFATYYFNKGAVWNIELSKNYNKSRAASEAYDGCMDYFLSVGAVPVEFYEGAKEKRVIATKAGVVYRLTMRKQDDTNIDVVLSSKMVAVAPMSELEGVDLIVSGEE